FVAVLLEDLSQSQPGKKLPEPAEKLFRTCVEKRSEEIPRFVVYLSRQQRQAEALDWCSQAWQKCAPEIAAAASLVALRGGSPGAEECQRVEKWLTTAQESNPQQVLFLVNLADLRDIQGRYTEAAALYRKALERDPACIVALNNLAWLLGLE